jgi:cytochrome P450
MLNVSELDLYHLPIGDQLFADDPNPHMLAAREKHSWLARSDFGTVVTEYAALDEIMRMDDKLKAPCEHVIDIMGGAGTNWARFQRECLIARDVGEHERIRSAIKKVFTPKAVSAYRARINQVVVELLDDWVPKGRFDFEAFASRFPIAVMFGLLGIPREPIEEVKDWVEMLGQSYSLDRSIFPQIRDCFDRLWGFAEELVKERKGTEVPGEPDLLDAMIEAETGGYLNATEIGDIILFLFAAGYDTSKNQLGHIMNMLLELPELWKRCAQDRSYCDAVVDEALRHSGVPTSYRNVAYDTEYRDVKFPVGTMLIFPTGIVCRYSGPFENPMDFNPDRSNAKRNTAFGRGMHNCLGQFLARLQMAEGLHLMAQRLKNPRRDGPLVWRLFPGVWGPKHLPIAFDGAAVNSP